MSNPLDAKRMTAEQEHIARLLRTMEDLPAEQRQAQVDDALLGPLYAELCALAQLVNDNKRRVEFEVMRRLEAAGAEVATMGDVRISRKATRAYHWDAETVRRLAPDMTILVPEAVTVVPEHYEVQSSTMLNNYIKRLGSQPMAEQLKATRSVVETWRVSKVERFDPETGEMRI